MANGEKPAGIDRKWWYVIGAGVAIVGYFVYKWYENQQATNAANAANSALSSEPSGAQTASTNLSPTTTSGTISTLEDWMVQAQSWLTSSLGADPATVQMALQNYANGTCLTNQEYNYIDQALGSLGMPPDAPYQGLIQCPNEPATTTTTTTSTTSSPFTAITNPATAQRLLGDGFNILTIGNGLYYDASQTTGKTPGLSLAVIQTPMEVRTLAGKGFTIYTIANGQFYNPRQVLPKKVA